MSYDTNQFLTPAPCEAGRGGRGGASCGPLGLFDSGFGGLSIFREIRRRLPDYDYIFLGDNGRAPYGNRTFDEVFRFTLQAVSRLFAMGCPLVILACNTASAKALRTIQQTCLPRMSDPSRRVLGVIRPTVEQVGSVTRSGHVGLVATCGTIASRSYELELAKLFPAVTLTGRACPDWVPLIEDGQLDTPALHAAVRRDLAALVRVDPALDTLILGCTHYPLVAPVITAALADLSRPDIALVAQGPLVGRSLAAYLARHADLAARLTRGGTVRYLTTGSLESFDTLAALFMGPAAAPLHAERLSWG